MPKVSGIARLPDGRFQILGVLVDIGDGSTIEVPIQRRLLADVGVTTPPSASGTKSPGQTVTGVGGTYTGPELTRVRFRWVQTDQNDNVYRTANGDTYLIPAASPSGELIVREDLIDAAGGTYSFISTAYTITRTSTAPLWTVHPTLTGTGRVNSVLTASGGTVTGTPTPTTSYLWYFDNVLNTNVTTATYTPVTADIGKKIKVRRYALNTAGEAYSSYTAEITVAAATGTVINVANLTELATALNGDNASGAEIRLASGTFTGNMTISNRTYASRATITAQDINNPPVLRGSFTFNNCRRFAVVGLHFIATARSTTRFQTTVEFPSGGYVPADSTQAIGIFDSEDFLISQNLAQFHHCSFEARRVERGEFSNNTVEYCGRDNFAPYDMQRDMLFSYNLIHKTFVHVVGTQESNRHADGIQFATNGTNLRSINVTCEYNWIETTQVMSMHGIFQANNAVRPTNSTGGGPGGQGRPFLDYTDAQGNLIAGQSAQNFVYRNNYIRVNHIQGLNFEAVEGGLVERNKLVRSTSRTTYSNTDIPNFYTLSNDWRDIVVRNNVAARAMPIGTGTIPAAQLTATNNVETEDVIDLTTFPTGWVPLIKEGTGKNVGKTIGPLPPSP
jgi:hypothetical protein